MKQATIRLTDELDAFVRAEAERRERSYSATVRELISAVQALAVTTGEPTPASVESEGRPIPWAGMVDDPTLVNARDLDRTLREGWADAILGDRR